MSRNCARIFFDTAERQADHPLILGPDAGDCVSYAQFRDEVLALAGALRAAGLRAGQNVGLLFPSGRQYIALVYALWACDACVTPLPVELTPAEKLQIFDHVHLDAVIAERRLIGQVAARLDSASTPLAAQALYAGVTHSCSAPPQLAAVNAAFIRFTSGTTGSAKGVVLSHESIHERICAANAALQLGGADRVLWLLSMDYHFAVSIVAYLSFGAAIILPKNSFGISTLTAARQHRATLMYASPTHYNLMVQDDSGMGLPDCLRFAIVTTTALPVQIGEAFYARFGQVLNETYGIIELGLPAINVSNRRDRQGSVGRLLPAYELRIECTPGDTQGEILLRSPGMLDAYYSPWQSREQILARDGGWLRTGDLGRLSEDGYLYIVGRSKDMISVGGLKFFPDEVETVLAQHPAIQAATVYGRHDGRWGQSVVAQLVLRPACAAPGNDELAAYCRQYLAPYKIPSQFQWVDKLSYTASGKVIRNPERTLQPIGS
ncbi:MAG: acyl--CoA ligase [Rhodocyclaceae bacterium]|nr:acyl--CoA ligase [Rhodocyclaceae bacterium]